MIVVPPTHRRALTLLELMLALSITALIAGAIWGMMNAVTAGVTTRRDNRSTMVGASAAATRIGAYIAPSRCLLDVEKDGLVIWLNDERQSDTVHATELRWMLYNGADGTLDVYFVSFPDGWSQAAKDLEDMECAKDANWAAILSTYDGKGWIASVPLVDRLGGINVSADRADALSAQHVSINLALQTTTGTLDVPVSSTIRMHRPPSS
jgi:hypothetical protein